MTKRKQAAGGSDSDSSDVSIVDVDFDFCALNPANDYQALKRLLVQLFSVDAPLLDLHDLTDAILASPHVGSTIKTDGEDSDPYGMLTVLDIHHHTDRPSVKTLKEYALGKAAVHNPAMHAALSKLFTQGTQHVGLVLCERFINMPVQVVPPMYRMLLEEIEAAAQKGEPYVFSHLLIFSRTYHLSLEEEAALANGASGRKKKDKKSRVGGGENPAQGRPEDGVYTFHPEDSVFIELPTTHHVTYPYTNAPTTRECGDIGLDTRGRFMLVPTADFVQAVQKMTRIYSAAS